MKYAHVLRDTRTRIDHAQVSIRRQPPKLDGMNYTICAIRLDENFQHRPGGYPGTVITCDPCSSFVVTLLDLSEGELGQPWTNVAE